MSLSSLTEHQTESEQQALWRTMVAEARAAAAVEPSMASFFHANVLNHRDFASAISFSLASRLGGQAMPAMSIQSLLQQVLVQQPSLVQQMMDDLLAHYQRDAACDRYILPLLYFKGYHAIQSYRFGHWLWRQQRQSLARFFQSRIAEVFDVDIHPAAQLGSGIMLDHATGLVVGETVKIGNDVSMLHGVTLGGSGAGGGVRHPQIGNGVLISAGAKLLGHISIGDGAKIGAGSVVLDNVPAHTTVAGVPARPVGRARVAMPSLDMDHSLEE